MASPAQWEFWLEHPSHSRWEMVMGQEWNRKFSTKVAMGKGCRFFQEIPVLSTFERRTFFLWEIKDVYDHGRQADLFCKTCKIWMVIRKRNPPSVLLDDDHGGHGPQSQSQSHEPDQSQNETGADGNHKCNDRAMESQGQDQTQGEKAAIVLMLSGTLGKAKDVLRSGDILFHLKATFEVQRPESESSWFFLVAKPFFRPYLMILCRLTVSPDNRNKLMIVDTTANDSDLGEKKICDECDFDIDPDFDSDGGDGSEKDDSNQDSVVPPNPGCAKWHETFLSSRKLCYNLLRRGVAGSEIAILDYETEPGNPQALNILMLKPDLVVLEQSHVPVWPLQSLPAEDGQEVQDEESEADDPLSADPAGPSADPDNEDDLEFGLSNLNSKGGDADDIEELLREFALDAASASESSAASKKEVAVWPAPPQTDYSRKGNAIYSKNRKVGTVNYLIHWNPPSFSGSCLCHDGCYITASIEKVDEEQVVKWLQDGLKYVDSESHLAFKPAGSYNKRRRVA
eukprot:s1867_g7.t1